MYTFRVLVLFSLVLFGVYAEHRAGESVKLAETVQGTFMHETVEHKNYNPNFMKHAIALSRIALMDDHGHPFGCVVVKNGEVIGSGWNKTRLLSDPSAHAEVEAIRDACRNLSSEDLTGCTLYASAHPCPMCLSLIYLTHIEKVFYCIPSEAMDTLITGPKVESIYREIGKAQHERYIPVVSVLPDEVQKTLNSYRALYNVH